MYFANGGYFFSDNIKVKGYLSNLAPGGYMEVGKDEEGNDLFLPNAFEGGAVKVYQYDRAITYADLQAVEQYIEGDIREECLLLLNNGLKLTEKDKKEIQWHCMEKLNKLAKMTKKGRIPAYFPLTVELLGSFPLMGDRGTYPRRLVPN
jgi:hypothetical protein